ncbi:MAG TPA: hypothetical protein VME46_08660, partial [Acidimicrobiales bacterium]|nr:hypothetical protein [Acidimicrobiales bacterium]
IFDEVDGVRGASEARLDHHSLRLHQILDEVGGARERVDRLDGRFGEVEASLVHQLEGQAQRQVELRSGFNELRQGMEKLELLFLAQLEGLFGAVHAEAAAVRKELVEVTRMLRMQGDAADQVAEVMGRTFERLSDEVLTLSETLGRLGLDTKEATAPA